MNKNKGFTLIELLVVIAIIGILSSVVLASLNTARNKGADAAIKSNLANTRAQAELVYDTAVPNSYAGVCTDPTVAAAVSAAILSSGSGTSAVQCGSIDAAWAIWVQLKTTTTSGWCVDNTGASKLVGTGSSPVVALPTAQITICP